MDSIQATKDLLSEHRSRIKLHDELSALVQATLLEISAEHFPIDGNYSADQFAERLIRYERAVEQLVQSQALIAFWGEPHHLQTLRMPARRLAGSVGAGGGLSLWLALRWYPVSLLLYSGGIAAIAAQKYEHLNELFTIVVEEPANRIQEPLITATTKRMVEFQDTFKAIPGYDRARTPRSEYFLNLLRPMLDTPLLLGLEYEAYFDEFEILYALEQVHQRSSQNGSFWGLPGRFAWKYHLGQYGSPYHRLITQAESAGAKWGPLSAGLFGGSIDRFGEIAAAYGNHLAQLHWY